MDQLQDAATQFMIKAGKAAVVDTASTHGIELKNGQVSPVIADPQGLTIIIPKSMNKLQGAFNLLQQFAEEETNRTYNRQYPNFFINDFMTTMGVLIPKYFGMLHVSSVDTNGRPAGKNYIQFPIGYNADGTTETRSGYVGSIKAPVWENAILDIYPNSIAVKAKLKFQTEVEGFLNDIERSLKAESIVNGAAVEVQQAHGGLMANPIKAKENGRIVLRENTARLIDNLVIPSLRDASKTSLLFTGDYGNGKTETAIKIGLTAKKRYGRTFFYLSNSGMFQHLIPYIKNYQPCVVFIEDIDQISSGDRDSTMNDLLNQLDGNELKNVNCTFIFTTNNHDKIHPAMRRPGRIDQVVHFDYCDVESIAKIFKLHVDGDQELTIAEEGIDYMKAAEACPENLQGAVVAEMARRAVKYAKNLHNGVISTERFLDAFASMEYQIQFMKNEQKKEHTAEELLGHILYKGMKKAFPVIDTADLENGENPFKGSGFTGLQS